MDLNMLYIWVSKAIRRAELLDDLSDPGALKAHLEVSFLEEQIARGLLADGPEGAIARRGAVRAAVAAGDLDRAKKLVERYSSESDASEQLRQDLEQLLLPALAKARPSTVSSIRFSMIKAGVAASEGFRVADHTTGDVEAIAPDRRTALLTIRGGVKNGVLRLFQQSGSPLLLAGIAMPAQMWHEIPGEPGADVLQVLADSITFAEPCAD